MSILYLLIPLSLMLLGLAVWAFFWAVRHDQFEDLEGPAYRILFDDDETDRPADKPPEKAAAEERPGNPPDSDTAHRDGPVDGAGEAPPAGVEGCRDGAVKKADRSRNGTQR